MLDNCEHVVDVVAGVVLAILRGCPNVKVLATSRQPLNVSGERSYRDAAEGARYAAVELFAERARAAGANFELGDANVRAVAEICRRLDGIPLAIELAATRPSVAIPTTVRQA